MPSSSCPSCPTPPPAKTARCPHQRRAQKKTAGPSKTDRLIAEHIARLVADAPPLSPEQRTRLAELFSINASRGRR